ncbi:hypothetical protein SAMN02746041_01426 [Desulfacinum hydrothermale DSM 13146]|uniref:Uncharacterized protein n=1 Tax=Desulfacinum hydrothermale DSM 13146 TaxID=1121390 RepID=A0A1W1XEX2_9BACT|nr:hypothetical protein SAMN02746041_01426 [Desulfacinum hydrothermale DSM 13146]
MEHVIEQEHREVCLRVRKHLRSIRTSPPMKFNYCHRSKSTHRVPASR